MPVRNTMEKIIRLRIVEKYGVHKYEKSVGAEVKILSLYLTIQVRLD